MRLKKKWNILVFFVAFIFFVVIFGTGIASAVTQSSCGTLSTENTTYTLNQSVNSTGTCFTISANNITLDCAGYTINYSQSSAGYGVSITTTNDTTIKNCGIVEENNLLINAHAIFATTGVKGTAVYNNTIRINSISGNGVLFYSTSYNNSVYSNTINTSSSGYAISLYITSYNNSVYSNTISTSGASGTGIYLYSTAYNNTIYNNNITTTATSNSFGIALASNVYGNRFWNNTIRANSSRIYLSGTVTNNTFENDTLIEGTTTTNYDIYSLSGAYNNNFTGLNFNRSDIGFGTGDNNITIKWFLTVNVTAASGQLSSASIAINDSANTNYSGATGTSGLVVFLINDAKLSNTGSNVSYNSQSINVSKTGYETNITSWNITSNTQENIFLTPSPTTVIGTQFYGYGRSVQMNLAFHIGASKSGDEFNYNNTYVLANDSVVAGLIFSGSQDFGTVVNNTVSATDYSLQLKQSLDSNRFYLVYTKGGWQKISEKLSNIDKNRLLARTFGDFFQTAPNNFPLFLRLDYYDVDIINRTEITRGVLVIKNEGKNSQGIWMVSIVMR